MRVIWRQVGVDDAVQSRDGDDSDDVLLMVVKVKMGLFIHPSISDLSS